MNYEKMKKEELIQELEKLSEVKNFRDEKEKEVIDWMKSNDAKTDEIFKLSKENDELKSQIKGLENNVKYLTTQLNSISDLFNEYINSYKRQLVLFTTVLENAKTIDEHLDNKISKFNGEEGKK